MTLWVWVRTAPPQMPPLARFPPLEIGPDGSSFLFGCGRVGATETILLEERELSGQFSTERGRRPHNGERKGGDRRGKVPSLAKSLLLLFWSHLFWAMEVGGRERSSILLLRPFDRRRQKRKTFSPCGWVRDLSIRKRLAFLKCVCGDSPSSTFW